MKTAKKQGNKFMEMHADPQLTASKAKLVYVSDVSDGIRRMRSGKNFYYVFKEKRVKEKQVLDRIKKLAIPPAWENVWICSLENGHLQATGYDIKKRKQYRYHPSWNSLRSETKFNCLQEFGKLLPKLRSQVEKDLAQKELTESKVLATVISLMERTYIRIGNEEYKKMNGSYGLTTLKDKHVEVKADKIRFSFRGKKGIDHDITLKSKKLARIVKECRDIPGQELFQYYDEKGERKSIDSSMVNNYIREATGGEFTAKEFRLWAGSLNLLRAFNAMEEVEEEKEKKQRVLQALDEVSLKLGNTRTVCKNYYVHPGIITLYEKGELQPYLKGFKESSQDHHIELSAEEKVLMKVLAA